MKYKFKYKHLLYVLLLFITIFFTLFTVNHVKFNALINNNQYFEAWQLTYDKPYYFILSKKTSDEQILFYNTMATHKQPNNLDCFDDGWILPDMTGWSCAEIACTLKNINQPYEIKFIDDYAMQHNLVVKHEPAVGESVSRDETITLYANSAYTGENVAAFYKFAESIIVECGEWVYFTLNTDSFCIYRTHIDFSDIKAIYTLNDGNYPNLFTLLAQNNYIYFQEKVSDDRYDLKKISSDGDEVVTLIEDVERSFILEIYMDKFYTASYILDLNTSKIQSLDSTAPFKWLFTSFKNQSYYYENIKDDETGNFTGNIYLFNYDNMAPIGEPILTIDGKIDSVKTDSINLYITYSSNENKNIVIAYDLNSQKTYSLANVYNGGIAGGSLDSVVIFRDSFYVIGNDIFDYKYDIHSKDRERVTIATMSDYTYDATPSSIILGNYLINTLHFRSNADVFNMLTFEHEHIDSFKDTLN